jgi:hypothetical protein
VGVFLAKKNRFADVKSIDITKNAAGLKAKSDPVAEFVGKM